MFLELIAAVFAAAAAAGLVVLANRMSGGRLPGWLAPTAAGAAMIFFAIVMEYNWFERSTGEFPEEVVVTQTRESSSLWRPWTYAVPLVDRFVALDTSAIRTNEGVPHQRMADLLFFGRWQPARSVPMVFDCDEWKGAPMVESVTFDETGAVQGVDWKEFPEDDETIATICKEIRP